MHAVVRQTGSNRYSAKFRLLRSIDVELENVIDRLTQVMEYFGPPPPSGTAQLIS